MVESDQGLSRLFGGGEKVSHHWLDREVEGGVYESCRVYRQEFEMPGSMERMIEMEMDLCQYLGFPRPDAGYPVLRYEDVLKKYNLAPDAEYEHEHEARMCRDLDYVTIVRDFPEHTSPFWNMRRYENNPDLARKVDVMIGGHETIGSAERSCNATEMRDRFMTISDGKYADTLFSRFGRDRVVRELDYFLSLDFFERSGGGIGITRMLNALRNKNLLLG